MLTLANLLQSSKHGKNLSTSWEKQLTHLTLLVTQNFVVVTSQEVSTQWYGSCGKRQGHVDRVKASVEEEHISHVVML